MKVTARQKRKVVICMSLRRPQIYALYKEFMETSELAQEIKANAALACSNMVGFIKDLNRFLGENEVESEIVVGKGCKFNAGGCAAGVDPESVVHGVIQVGKIVLDPLGKMRFGGHYEPLDNYPLSVLHKYWTELTSPSKVLEFRRHTSEQLK